MQSERSETFKEATLQLEAILKRIDTTDVGIDEVAEQVEVAAELLKVCHTQLHTITQRIQSSLESLDTEFSNQESNP